MKMAKVPTNAEYSYHLPTGGLVLRVRNFLSQFSDLFSEFNKYIAPAFHHDRCERSAHMRLYTMHKREFLVVFLAFFACFGLAIFIGLAGPPITWASEVNASTLIPNTTTKPDDFLANGPFSMKTPLMTTYSQQLWLIAVLSIDNNDDETFDKSFQVSVEIDGVNEDHKPVSVLPRHQARNRTRHLKCMKSQCEEFTVLHLGFLNYAHYIITVRLYDLTSFNQRYHIKDLKFVFKTYNPGFTQIEIWFRFIFLFSTFVVTCWYAHTLRKYPMQDWSIEQKWVAALLPLLVLYDNPIFPLMFLVNSSLPGILDAVFQATFLCGLLMFWLCIYHGLRQNERRIVKFYIPKIIVILPLWLCAIHLAIQEKVNELQDPTYSHLADNGNYNSFKTMFFIAGAGYLLYLAILILRTYSELRSMPYFDTRLKFLSFFMIFVMSITVSVTMGRFGFGVLEDNFVANLNTTYKSSAEFMCFYGLLNFYLYTMAYVYSPDEQAQTEPRAITKDNPAFSMVNDSDSEVIYGDDESRRPLNSTGKGNDYDSD